MMSPSLEASTIPSSLKIENLHSSHRSLLSPHTTKPSLPLDMTEEPLIQYINQIMIDAVKQNSSDLHFEPYENGYRIRCRIDGILHEVATLALKLGPRITSRLKIMANLDISERRLPQDGRFKIEEIPELKKIDFRISSCPTLFGEKVVLRILTSFSNNFNIDELGFEPFQKALLLHHLQKPQGLILFTGPTGSGKTRSLYSSLNILNNSKRNIMSCEDPIEIDMPGLNQVNVNPKTGLNFATVLRTFLRQDPDVIMIGEIRDLETAEIALKASETGHLVLSTLHTNSAAGAIHRLLHIGVPSYALSTTLSLVIAQRLVRKLCNHCKSPCSWPPTLLTDNRFKGLIQPLLKSEISSLTSAPLPSIYSASHTISSSSTEYPRCPHCKFGYQGRTAIYECLPISSNIQTCILNNGNAHELQEQAILEGMWDLQTSALNKVKLGVTSLEEIDRVVTLSELTNPKILF